MSNYLPVRPNLEQLKQQAKDLLHKIRSNDLNSIEQFKQFHTKIIPPEEAKLADAQFVLARSYGIKNWERLVKACNLIDSIWQNEIEILRKLVTKYPYLIHENARGTEKCNWGSPMSYAANLGRNEIIKMLAELGANDFQHAIARATLQSKIDTAEILYQLIGSPPLPEGALAGPAYTLSVSGTAFALRVGAEVVGINGKCLAPVDVVLETDSRNPAAKHAILEMYVAHRLKLPDTPIMALHRGRIDLLEEHLERDPKLLQRTFSHEEIYPPEFGCHDEVLATQGTPLAGTTLLHLCVDYDEFEIAKWLIEKGADVNAKSVVDAEGFGGYSALFSTVVSQPNFWMNYQNQPQEAIFTKLLLEHGANPKIRASIRKKLHPGYAPKYDVENTYKYHNVTAIEWGEQFHAKVFVNQLAVKLIGDSLENFE